MTLSLSDAAIAFFFFGFMFWIGVLAGKFGEWCAKKIISKYL
jgi:hypothetical protein